ncbi:hypothetical protein C8R44DRAFT_753402 [Mycena epipterygia]|nr:hypothetical protein C8R44DRAFT_753402 [Mycena epipterygia]
MPPPSKFVGPRLPLGTPKSSKLGLKVEEQWRCGEHLGIYTWVLGATKMADTQFFNILSQFHIGGEGVYYTRVVHKLNNEFMEDKHVVLKSSLFPDACNNHKYNSTSEKVELLIVRLISEETVMRVQPKGRLPCRFTSEEANTMDGCCSEATVPK